MRFIASASFAKTVRFDTTPSAREADDDVVLTGAMPGPRATACVELTLRRFPSNPSRGFAATVARSAGEA